MAVEIRLSSGRLESASGRGLIPSPFSLIKRMCRSERDAGERIEAAAGSGTGSLTCVGYAVALRGLPALVCACPGLRVSVAWPLTRRPPRSAFRAGRLALLVG